MLKQDLVYYSMIFFLQNYNSFNISCSNINDSLCLKNL